MSSDALPEPPWSSRRDRTPRRPPLTREALVAAALRVVDAEGFDALSMRRIAQELGVQASALYVHVSGRAELLQLLIDAVAAELTVPAPDPARWREQTAEVMRAMRASLLAHRDLARAAIGNIPTGHNALAIMDGLLAILLAGGLSRQAAAYAADLLPQYVVASAYEASVFEARIAADPAYFEDFDRYLRALPASRFPALADLADELASPDEHPDARFEFGIDVLVRGLAGLSG